MTKTTRTERIEVTDYSYRASHGKAPRGRGSWAFSFNGNEDIDSLFWTPGHTTYAEAKKLARAAAPEGTYRIDAQP